MAACPSCTCSIYNTCYCDFWGIEIVNYAISDWAKSGYKISAIVDTRANQSGVITPWKK